MKLITDFKPAVPANKFDADAAELIEAFKADEDVIGAITVNVLAATDDNDAANIIAKETRLFQAATLKAGYSARSRDTRDNGDGTFDVLFSMSVHKARKPRETAPVETETETAPVEAAPVEVKERKSGK